MLHSWHSIVITVLHRFSILNTKNNWILIFYFLFYFRGQGHKQQIPCKKWPDRQLFFFSGPIFWCQECYVLKFAFLKSSLKLISISFKCHCYLISQNIHIIALFKAPKYSYQWKGSFNILFCNQNLNPYNLFWHS